MGVAQINTFPLFMQVMIKGNEIDIILGEILREERLKKNLSQEKLAEYGEFERSYISKVENGERSIQVKTLIRFAIALELKPSDLITKLEQQIEM